MKSFVPAIIVAASALLAAATPVRRDSGGCLVNLQPSVSNPDDVGEVVTYGILDRWEATAPSYVPISSANLGINITAYTCFITPDASEGFDDAYVTAVVQKWPGAYLFSGTSTPEADTQDYLVTSVSCS